MAGDGRSSSVADAIIKSLARRLFKWLHENHATDSDKKVLQTGLDRDQVGELYQTFLQQEHNLDTVIDNGGSSKRKKRKQKRQEGLVMSSLRSQKLMKSKRYDGEVVCVFARSDGKSFAPVEERQSGRQALRQRRRDLHENKQEIVISEEPTTRPHKGPVMPMNEDVTVEFTIRNDGLAEDGSSNKKKVTLVKSIMLSGSHKKHFTLKTQTPIVLNTTAPNCKVRLAFRATSTAAYRATVIFTFLQENNSGGKGKDCNSFAILRNILLRSGDADMYDALKPKTPYQKKTKKKRGSGGDNNEPRIKKEDVFHPPKQERTTGGSGGSTGYNGLEHFRITKDVRRIIQANEMEDSLVPPWDETYENNEAGDEEFNEAYTTFWQSLLWASELQAYRDVELFDMENVALENRGRFLKLYVSGLAEGRPSVLRGDIVICTWKSREYRGRVVTVEQLDVLMEFNKSFHHKFNVNVDRVDRVRFTFTRTPFRTAHAGIVAIPESMGRSMLMPSKTDGQTISTIPSTERICPTEFRWTSGAAATLNEEQKQAVREIVKGTRRPLPYVIFGPPGTGKTTTMVEAVYQLANLHTYDQSMKTKKQLTKLKILLVAPSNDATDILVEKLSPYFPPSEMIRVLAFTRSMDQVPESVRPYCKEGMDSHQLLSKIHNVQITVATINMAARLWCTGDGVQKGYFDVLCVDEAGHATEPEVVAVAATIMKFQNANSNPGQLILAGDPMQLGPIITSDLCKKFKMDRSYMERLVNTSPAYNLEGNSGKYPPELVTLLVNNYRSHPDILKLPNEMFYRNQLVTCGDKFTTHSMAKWEHLPKEGFPIIFHAVDGENTREGNSPSWFNPQEAMVVVDYVKNLVKHSKPKICQEDIGIITPYARQVQKIRLALKVSDVGDVKVGSVETFQGQERRVIIISTVRSENELLSHDRKYNLGFVANEKRFNVAVTRAKALLIVIGNPRVLATDEKNWLPLLRFCRDNNSWLGQEWDEDASSDGEDETFDIIDGDDIADVDEDEWAVVAQEAHGFINREE